LSLSPCNIDLNTSCCNQISCFINCILSHVCCNATPNMGRTPYLRERVEDSSFLLSLSASRAARRLISNSADAADVPGCFRHARCSNSTASDLRRLTVSLHTTHVTSRLRILFLRFIDVTLTRIASPIPHSRYGVADGFHLVLADRALHCNLLPLVLYYGFLTLQPLF